MYQGLFDERSVAIKTIRPDTSTDEKKEFRREAEVMRYSILHCNTMDMYVIISLKCCVFNVMFTSLLIFVFVLFVAR